MMQSLAKCDAGDWIGIAALTGIGLFSLTFLGLGIAVLARSLLWTDRNKLGAP